MGRGKWDKVIELLEASPTATPEKVLKSLSVIYGKKNNQDSFYQTLRSSWPIDVVYNIYHRTGSTNKTKAMSVSLIVRNWVKSQDYRLAYNTFHPGVGNKQWDLPGQEKFMKMRMFKDLSIEKHIRNCCDIWRSANGKSYRKELEKNHGQYSFTNYITKEESDALGPLSSPKLKQKLKKLRK